MTGLLIDTALKPGTLALYKDDTLIDEIIFSSELNHLQHLHPSIVTLLDKHDLKIKELDYLGVDIGPGSFTGIRIGVTTARTIAQLINKDIYGVCSLDIIARYGNNYENLICAVLDGKKNRVYTSLYINENKKVKCISDYMDISPEELINRLNKLKNHHKEVLFVGSGQEKYKDILNKTELKCLFTGEAQYYPLAKNIYSCIDFNKKSSFREISPFYLRKSDAEENLTNK